MLLDLGWCPLPRPQCSGSSRDARAGFANCQPPRLAAARWGAPPIWPERFVRQAGGFQRWRHACGGDVSIGQQPTIGLFYSFKAVSRLATELDKARHVTASQPTARLSAVLKFLPRQPTHATRDGIHAVNRTDRDSRATVSGVAEAIPWLDLHATGRAALGRRAVRNDDIDFRGVGALPERGIRTRR